MPELIELQASHFANTFYQALGVDHHWNNIGPKHQRAFITALAAAKKVRRA